MKIACVTWSYDEHQGISRCVVELTGRLAGAHEMHVFAAETAVPSRPGVQVHRVPLRYTGRHVNDWDFFFRAGRLLRQGDFDLVHLHFPVCYTADIYTCHGLARMALRSFRRFPAKAKVDVPTFRMLPWYVQVPLYTHVARNARTLITAVSRKAQAEVAEEGRRPLSEIAIVPNAVDLQRFRSEARQRMRAGSRDALRLSEGQFVLCMVGNHLRHKGIRHALATLERLPADVVLLVVGADSKASVPDMAGAIERLEAEGRLRFQPADAAIEKYYAAADALLFPSLYESFGLVLLEAMAMGIPVVTARTVGFADEAIEDGVNGFLVDHPWDDSGMAERIQRMRLDPELCRRVGESGCRVAQRYGWDEYVRRTEAIYAQALTARARRGERVHAA